MFHNNRSIADDLEPNTSSTGLGNYLVETYTTLFLSLDWDEELRQAQSLCAVTLYEIGLKLGGSKNELLCSSRGVG